MSVPLRIVVSVAAVVAVVAIVAIILRGGSASTPETLAAGDCIDVPTSAAIATIPKRSCTEAHAGEVFHAFAAPAGSGAYPSDPAWAELIYPVCDPAFEAYTGEPVQTRTDIDYSYFVPTPEGWNRGDRRVTCFLKSIDGSPLVRSYRASG